MSRYFYARVSTREQNLDRQLIVARDYSEPIDRIFADKMSGKNMERAEYNLLKETVQAGDEVIIKELDRLGRNKELVKDEIRWFRDKGVVLRILNVPSTMIDFGDQKWIGDMVNNIIIEVLSAVAENELEKIHQRQREGIDAMEVVNGKRVSARTGSGFGVDPYEVPGFDEAYERVLRGESDAKTEWDHLGICKSKWYRLAKAKRLAA
jgi:DNA invertase Pin-like site-specific DNA recombinase